MRRVWQQLCHKTGQPIKGGSATRFFFRLKVFFMNPFPPGSWVYKLQVPLGPIQFFFLNSRSYSQLKVHPVTNLPPVSLIPAASCHRWCTLTCEYLREFLKNSKMTLTLFSGPWEKMIHEKNVNKKSRDTVPFLKLFSDTYLPTFFTILSWTFHLQFSFHDRVWHRTRGSTIPTSRSLPASTAHSGSDTPAPFSFTSGSTQVSQK